MAVHVVDDRQVACEHGCALKSASRGRGESPYFVAGDSVESDQIAYKRSATVVEPAYSRCKYGIAAKRDAKNAATELVPWVDIRCPQHLAARERASNHGVIRRAVVKSCSVQRGLSVLRRTIRRRRPAHLATCNIDASHTEVVGDAG